jgi:hypothetical protein
MKQLRPATVVLIALLLILPTWTIRAQELSESGQLIERLIQVLQTRNGDAERDAPLAELLQEAEKLRTEHPDSAEAWLTVARIRFWYADTQSIRKGLEGLETVRAELEQAMVLDANVSRGLAQAFLGYIYYAAPPWPLGFRDRDEGERLLRAALAIGPESAHNNFFYGMVRMALGEVDAGAPYLRKVQQVLERNPQLSLEEGYLLQGVENLLAGR